MTLRRVEYVSAEAETGDDGRAYVRYRFEPAGGLCGHEGLTADPVRAGSERECLSCAFLEGLRRRRGER
jgi:hypothetical protein